MFSAAPRKPSSTGTAAPASMPTPISKGKSGFAPTSSSQTATSSTAARTACFGDKNTANASSPRSSITLPPRASTASRASPANVRASRAASTSPRSRVNRV